jgi:hypothetical protein
MVIVKAVSFPDSAAKSLDIDGDPRARAVEGKNVNIELVRRRTFLLFG